MRSLRKKEDFDKVFKRPDYKINVSGLYLRASKNRLEYSRLGMAISKKVIKKSTRRNALKRRLRLAFIENMDKSQHLDSVVVAVPPIKEFDDRQMTKASRLLFKLLHKKAQCSPNNSKK